MNMSLKRMPLLFADVCRECSSEVAAKAVAFYDPADKRVVCQACHGPEASTDPLASLLTTPSLLHTPPAAAGFPPPVRGTAVAGPPTGVKRGKSPIAKRRGGQSERVDRDRTLGALLAGAFVTGETGGPIVVLHSRQAPNTRGVIDHLVVASSGVWVIDAAPGGKAEHRQVGTRRSPETRLFVNDTDQSELVAGIAWQTNAIRAVLDPIHLGESPIHPTIVPTSHDQGRFAKPFEIDGVRVTWGKHLTELIAQPGPLDEPTLRAITIQLNLKLATKR